MRSILQKSNAIFSAAALAVLLAAGTPAVAFARGSEVESSTSGTRVAETGSTETETSTEVHATSETEATTTETNHSRGEREVKALRAEKKVAKTDTERQKTCEARKSGLEMKFTSIARNSSAYQTRINDIYAKTLAYQVKSNLNPTGFSSLVAAADAAKAKAETSVAALAAAKPTVECTHKTVATDVATFKVTAATARTDLKAYKQAIKAVVKSLRDAKNAATSTSTETKPTEGTN
ncbi:MAG: hypothetical protein QFB87_02885 [Patescibacteria group bacterium]|nr:hypothetical protein [Patescibacteria group bacterium]